MDGINITRVQNVSFIGLNQHVIINSKVHHYNPLTIFNSTNISIVNITIPRVLFFHDDISIVYSQDIFILNVNIFSMSIHDSFEVTVYNTYVYHFYGQFGPSVHCYDTLQFHNLKFINSTLGFTGLTIEHSTTYIINTTLDNVLFAKLDTHLLNLITVYANSLYSININNVSCYGHIQIVFKNNYYNTSCIPISVYLLIIIFITNSYFIDGLSI